VSVTIELRAFDTGDDRFVDDAWGLKERIRRSEDVLKQRRGFFTDAYRRSKVYALVEPGYDDETLVGFASTRRDGYILFLAVAPEYRGEGFGRQLVAAVATTTTPSPVTPGRATTMRSPFINTSGSRSNAASRATTRTAATPTICGSATAG